MKLWIVMHPYVNRRDRGLFSLCVCLCACERPLQRHHEGFLAWPALIDRGCRYLLTFSGWVISQRKGQEMEADIFLLGLLKCARLFMCMYMRVYWEFCHPVWLSIHPSSSFSTRRGVKSCKAGRCSGKSHPCSVNTDKNI